MRLNAAMDPVPKPEDAYRMAALLGLEIPPEALPGTKAAIEAIAEHWQRLAGFFEEEQP